MTDVSNPTDCMDQRWCCLTCSAMFRVGRIRTCAVDERHPHGLGCPQCGSGDMHPANGETVELPEYHGRVGTQQ